MPMSMSLLVPHKVRLCVCVPLCVSRGCGCLRVWGYRLVQVVQLPRKEGYLPPRASVYLSISSVSACVSVSVSSPSVALAERREVFAETGSACRALFAPPCIPNDR
mmetsp:Transcript_17141/g.38742  ORF Transcript_17141/g.38742 Transcript_17141/m.38742 type:complete len:106 (-) Transcript_17141:87-404(-)